MKILINKPQYLSEAGIKMLEETHGEGTLFIGSWSLQCTDNSWSDATYDIMYLRDSRSLVGYKREITFFGQDLGGVKVNANPSFSQKNKDILCLLEDDCVYVSRYRHDFVSTPSGLYLDGGRDYCRSNTMDLYKVFFDTNIGKFVLFNDNVHGYRVLDIEYIDMES